MDPNGKIHLDVSSQNCKRSSRRSTCRSPQITEDSEVPTSYEDPNHRQNAPFFRAILSLSHLSLEPKVPRPRVKVTSSSKVKHARNQLTCRNMSAKENPSSAALYLAQRIRAASLRSSKNPVLFSSRHDPSASIRSSVPLSVLITLLHSSQHQFVRSLSHSSLSFYDPTIVVRHTAGSCPFLQHPKAGLYRFLGLP